MAEFPSYYKRDRPHLGPTTVVFAVDGQLTAYNRGLAAADRLVGQLRGFRLENRSIERDSELTASARCPVSEKKPSHWRRESAPPCTPKAPPLQSDQA